MRLLLTAVLCAAPSSPPGGVALEGGAVVRLGAAGSDGGCQLKVDDVLLELSSAPCDVTALKETYPVGALGEATFVARSAQAYGGRLALKAEAAVKAHQHEGSMEVVVVQSGRGTFSLDGGTREVGPGEVVVVPKGVTHSFVAGPVPVRVIQFYLPPGPELRFRPQGGKP